MKTLAALLPLVGLVACGDPVGSWQLVAGAEATLALDSTDFEQLGEATATFTLPLGDGDDPAPGAFYRLEASFERGGAAPEPASLERVFVRVSPRFESFDGTTEVTTFLMADADDEPQRAALVTQGSLTPCVETGPCERGLGLFLGWLAPPPDGATLQIQLALTVELRGSGSDEVPETAAASAVVAF